MNMDELLVTLESAATKTANAIDSYRHTDRNEKHYLKAVEENISTLSMLIEMFNLKSENESLKMGKGSYPPK